MTPDAADLQSQPLITDDEIVARVGNLVGAAERRQFWLLLLDADDCQLPFLLPMADYPPSPDDDAPLVIARAAVQFVEELCAAQVVVVWERRLSDIATPLDKAWARGVADAFRDAGVRLRGQLLSHRTGVRWLAPDEFVV
jgi:hypothetical protein